MKGKGYWVKLSVNYFDDDRIMEVGVEAELLFVRGLAWAKRSDSSRITKGALIRLGLGLSDPTTAVSRLVEVGLWLSADNGWDVAAWDVWQGDGSKMKMSEGGQLGNHRRWHTEPDPDCLFCIGSVSGGDRVTDDDQTLTRSQRTENRTRDIDLDQPRLIDTTSNAELMQAFQQWWEVWPKRVGKGHAEKAYMKAHKLAGAADLLAGAARIAKAWGSMDDEQRQYVPHPSTWLNGQRWLDEVEEPTQPPKVTYDPDCPVCHGEGVLRIGDWESNEWARCVVCVSNS